MYIHAHVHIPVYVHMYTGVHFFNESLAIVSDHFHKVSFDLQSPSGAAGRLER